MKNEKHKMIRNIVLFLILLIITFWFVFKDQDFNELVNIIFSTNKWFILFGLITMLLFFLIESINIKLILKTFGDKISIFRALKYTFIGFFFSAITPASSGGQPMEIYYMTQDKVSGVHGTLALLIEACGYQIGTLSLGIICAIFNPYILSSGLLWLFFLGIIINGCALTILLISIFSKKMTQKLANFLIKILKFFHFKNIAERKKKIHAAFSKYQTSAKYIKEHKRIFIMAILRAFAQIICLHIISYFVYRSLGFNELNVFKVFAVQAVLFNMVSGIPLPGSIGVSEIVYLHIYNIIYPEVIIHSAMLLTRSINFYYYVLISLIVVIINAFFIGNKKVD